MPSSLKTIHILHVDDDPSFTDQVTTFLEREREHFSVHSETNPKDALNILCDDNTEFACVISGYEMSELNGLEFLRHVRETSPHLPFILFTGNGSEEIASEAITAGVTEYLQKDSTDQYQKLATHVQNAVEQYSTDRYLDRSLEAIETAHEGVAILSNEGHFEYLNAAYADLLGYDRDELLDKHWEILYREEDVHEIYEILLPAAREGRWSGHTDFVRKDETITTVKHTLSYTDDGALICTLSRLTGDESVETALSVRERAMDEAPSGIILTDPHAEDNPIIYANKKFSELTGYERDEILGQNCRFLQGSRTEEEPVARLREAIDSEEAVTVELRNYRKDGTEFWNRVRVAPLFDNDGNVEYFVGFQDDVTIAKSRKEQLQSQTARLEALFEHSPDMVAIHDADGIIRDVNHRFCDELGYTENEVLGKAVWDMDKSADPDNARSFWQDLPTNTPQRFEGELERADGTDVPVEIHLIRLNLDGKDRFVAMDRDITEQKERETELINQNERLDQFTSIVSHDLRNPLNVAEGYVDRLKDECDSEHISDIEIAHDRMEALIDDLLTLSQVGDEAMETEQIELSSVATECWNTVATEQAILDIQTDRTVEADRDQLKQLFENLFRNAIEHAGDDVLVTVGEMDHGFYVADNGTGIPPAERTYVFDEGYTTETEGTGFGLNIVSQVIDAHDWSISITDGPNGGARFDISTASC